MTKGIEDKPVQVVGVLNLILLLVPTVLITWTWYYALTDDGDNMFLGVFMVALFVVTVYYVALTVWGISLVRTSSTGSIRPLILFLLNVVPMTLIYYYTS